jgi:hypothetical protein
MAMRCALTSLPARLRSPAAVASGTRRLLSDGKGGVLREEERAKETVYIQVGHSTRIPTLNPSYLTPIDLLFPDPMYSRLSI